MAQAKYRDNSGVKIHRLTFLEYIETDKRGNARWKVRCDCVTEFVTHSMSTFCGKTKSCGCYRNEQIRNYHKNK
jgi:hypothetical protein